MEIKTNMNKLLFDFVSIQAHRGDVSFSKDCSYKETCIHYLLVNICPKATW